MSSTALPWKRPLRVWVSHHYFTFFFSFSQNCNIGKPRAVNLLVISQGCFGSLS